ncbi:hypothetical protein D3C76_1661410 [compost metagenome]
MSIIPYGLVFNAIRESQGTITLQLSELMRVKALTCIGDRNVSSQNFLQPVDHYAVSIRRQEAP